MIFSKWSMPKALWNFEKIIQSNYYTDIKDSTEPIYESSSQSEDYGSLPNNLTLKDFVTSASHISKLPKKCFKTVKVPILQEDQENEIDFEDPYPLIAGEEERTYIRAKYVMQHFSASFFEMMRDLSKYNNKQKKRVWEFHIIFLVHKYI